MGCGKHKLMHGVRQLAVLAILAVCLAAGPAERPAAVIITEPTAELLGSVYPALTAVGAPPVLLYAPGLEPYVTEYLGQISARSVWVIDPRQTAPKEWRQRFQVLPAASRTGQLELVRRCWTDPPPGVVLVGSSDSRLILAASLLATARGIPAIYVHGELDEASREWLRKPSKLQITCVGTVLIGSGDFPGSQIDHLTSVAETLAAYQAALGERAIEHLIVVGPPPTTSPTVDCSALIPQYALRHRAAVVMLESSKDLERQLSELVNVRYPAVKYVTLWGGQDTLADEQVEDPVAAAGLETKLTEPTVAVAPLSGLNQGQPCQFRVGRITGENTASMSLLLARILRRPRTSAGEPPTAMILANLDYELPLMETITRTTEQTFNQCGWQVGSFYGWRAGYYRKPNRLWGADLVLYEGHTAYLANTVQFDQEREPVFPGLYVFQGCKTLRQPEVMALLRNGAMGVVGTTTNTYSASGSALAKTYVDCMLLDKMDAGTSLMVARNFMLALAELKERRGHEQGPKILRGGLTFSLWGDPSWTPPPSPQLPADQTRVRGVRKGNNIELLIPESRLPLVQVKNTGTDEYYVAEVPVGAKLAGMYEWEDQEHTRRQLPPLYFAVVPLPDYDTIEPPQLKTPLAKNRWSSLWDPRNRLLYLLVQSSPRNDFDKGKKLSFHIEKTPE